MPYYNPFADDWRESLRAHYMHVIRVDDKATERTLSKILLRLGFTDAELAEMRVFATMRTEDMGADFVPDFAAVEALVAAEIEAAQQEAAAQASAPEQPSAAAPLFPAFGLPDSTLNETASMPSDVEGVAPDEPEPADEPAAPPPDEYYAPPDDTPQQLSLF